MKRPKNHHSILTFQNLTVYLELDSLCSDFSFLHHGVWLLLRLPRLPWLQPAFVLWTSWSRISPGARWAARSSYHMRDDVRTHPFPARMPSAQPPETHRLASFWDAPFKSVVHMRIGQTLGCGWMAFCCLSLRHQIIVTLLCVCCLLFVSY